MADKNKKRPFDSHLASETATPPVSYAVFSKSIKNLPDIAFQIQSRERKKGVTKSLDECAKWYYKAFYFDPKVRQEYEFKLNAISLKVKKTLLKSCVKEAEPVSTEDEQAPKLVQKEAIRGQQADKKQKRQQIDDGDIETEMAGPSPIVRFEVFEKYVKNLYEIVCKLKLLDPVYACKGFEDCAEAFYLDFYINPEIREKYPIELKNCTPALRDKIFYLPNQEEANELQKQFIEGPTNTVNRQELELNRETMQKVDSNVRSSYSVEVNLGKAGCFLFPVSIDVFGNFINYDDIIEPLLRLGGINDECELSRLKANNQDPVCQQILKRYYNSFYVNAAKRDLVQYKFLNASEEMQEILLSHGQPLDTKAEKTVKDLCQTKQMFKGNIRYPISFKQFQKCIQNLNEIVQQMMECGKYKYLPESRECYMKEYYKLFYTLPKIRDRFTYKLAPCPAAIKNKLLQIPEKSSEKKVKADPIVRTFDGVHYEYPVSLKTMAKFINYKELIKQLREAHEKHKLLNGGPSFTDAQLMLKYYNHFYINERFRNMFNYNFEAAPTELRVKLLSFAKPIEAKQTEQEIENISNNSSVGEIATLNLSNPLNERAAESLEKENSISNEVDDINVFPVTFQTFQAYIQNLSEIAKQMKLCDKYKDKTENECFLEYYKEFYSSTDIRQRYNYKLKPCPSKMKQKILGLAALPPIVKSNNVPLVNCEKDLISRIANFGCFKYPVSFETFKQYINYIDLYRPVVLHVTNDESLLSNPENPKCLKLFRRYYNSFYVYPYIREKYPYKFNCPDKQLLQKLLSYAEPLDDKAKQTLAEGITKQANELPPVRESGQSNEKQLDLPQNREKTRHVTPPVSFLIFSSLLHLDEVVDQMQREPLYAKLSRRDCEMAYYHAFYSQPSIRDKYACRMKPCPTTLKIKLLSIPEARCPAEDGDSEYNKAQNMKNVLYERRKFQLASKTKINFVIYNLLPPKSRKDILPTETIIDETSTTANVSENMSNQTEQLAIETADATSYKIDKAMPCAETISKAKSNSSSTTTTENPKVAANFVENSTAKPGSTGDKVTQEATASSRQLSSATVDQRNQGEAFLDEEAEKIFFSPSCNEHNMKYLLCNSHGLQKTIWRILSQLKIDEFETYTGIHNGESLYENKSMLSRCYAHVIEKGNWPQNLYVKLPMLHDLLLSKGVYHPNHVLSELSPKIVHWNDLSLFTNFDEIVESMYLQRTKKAIGNVILLDERVILHKRCWQHNRWIPEAPHITNEELIKKLAGSETMPSQEEPYRRPLCMEESEEQQQKALNDAVVEVDTEQQNLSVCPPTQLNLSYFVDVDAESLPIQDSETQNDPLLERSISMPNEARNLHLSLTVKQEPVKFLDRLRFICNSNSNEGFECETISADENIIVLDDDSDRLIMEKLKCFHQPREEDKATSSSHLQTSNSVEPPADEVIVQEDNDKVIVQEVNDEMAIEAQNSKVSEQATTDKANNAEGHNLPPQIAVIEKRVACKRKPTGKNTTATKKARVMPDFVAQLKHAFRPLPLNAMVRIETNSTVDTNEEVQPVPPHQQLQPQVGAQLTASQAFAIDDTLLKSSQLQELLDGPNEACRKVNKVDTRVNEAAALQPPTGNQSITVVYRQLRSYLFIRSLTMAQTREYSIDRLAVGQPYQRASIQVMKRNVYLKGPLLQALFPHISSTLLADLKFLLCAVEKFNWDWHHASIEKALDLRLRVLTTFIEVAPRFGHFRLKYESEQQELNWAACSLISIQDPEFEKRQPAFDLLKTIKPRILENMKQFSINNKKKY